VKDEVKEWQSNM